LAGGTAPGGPGASDGAPGADKTAVSWTHVEMYISITHISTGEKKSKFCSVHFSLANWFAPFENSYSLKMHLNIIQNVAPLIRQVTRSSPSRNVSFPKKNDSGTDYYLRAFPIIYGSEGYLRSRSSQCETMSLVQR
jgi:hypothetical protein